MLDQRHAELAERAQLEVGVAGPARELPRLSRPPLRRGGIAAVVRPHQQHPALERRQLELLDQPRSPPQPARRGRRVAQADPVVEVERDRGERRPGEISAGAGIPHRHARRTGRRPRCRRATSSASLSPNSASAVSSARATASNDARAAAHSPPSRAARASPSNAPSFAGTGSSYDAVPRR